MSTTPTPDQPPLTRREVFLRVALAVAKDGLPEPRDLIFIESAHALPPLVEITFDGFEAANRWGSHLRISRESEITDHGNRRVLRSGWDDKAMPGWSLQVVGRERDSAPTPPELAAEVAAAIEGDGSAPC